MAMTTAIQRPERDARETGLGLVLAGDRTVEYKRARRGTIRVRILRLALPLVALGLVGTYATTLVESTGLGSNLPQMAIRQILPEDLAMNNPHYEGFSKDGGAYEFRAQKAHQDITRPTLIKLTGIEGTLTEANKSRTLISAARAEFDHSANVLELFDDINVASESGLKAKLTRATVLTKESILTSPEPVLVEFPSGSIRSSTMTLRQKAREVTFVENVVANFTAPPDAGQKDKAAASASQALFRSDAGPIEITANRLDANDQTKNAIFTGNVKAVQGGSALVAPEIEINYDGAGMMGAASTPPSVNDPVPQSTTATAASKIRRIVAKNGVIMTRSSTESVTSDSAEFDAETETAALIGNVIMSSGPNQEATSDRVDLDQKSDLALLVGDVVVKQAENQLRGRRLLIDRKSGKAQLTSPPGLGAGPGRITAHLTRADEAAVGKASKKQAATRPNGLGGITTFTTDPTAPVDIEADQLDIDDTAKVAVFRGDVHAIQGDFVIKSSEISAYYKGSGGLAGALGSAPTGDKTAAKAELTRIEAKHNVVVSSSQGQTATGDAAEFNTKTNTVVMTGDVVLAQGQNMVRGTRLVIDVSTGESKIDIARPATASSPDSSGWVTRDTDPGATATPGGRASAVFFPQLLKDAKKSSQKPPSVDDAWSTTTAPSKPQTLQSTP